MKTKLFLISFTALFNAFVIHNLDVKTSASSEVFIYGTVVMENGEEYTGQIRWGNEEVFWFDYFNSSKPENEFVEYLSDSDLKIMEKNHRSANKYSLFNNMVNNWNDSNHTHSFAAQFGDIQKIDIRSKSKVVLTFKNGDEMRLKGGSNDIGAKVQVFDHEIGLIKLEWKHIDFVEFKNTPKSLENYFGDPLYGTVNTDEGSFTGYLQWDHDERVSNDELNGEYDDGDLDIKFGKIKTIKKLWRGSEVTLHSGRVFELDGSNDVDDDNRGIIVNIPGQGRVDIEWDEFKEIEFTTAPKSTLNYAAFTGQQKIRGTVQTEAGKTLTGEIVYDLDEAYQLEILNGMLDDIEYFIPFANIEQIEREGRRHTIVKTKDGHSFDLDDKVDVDENNDGLLVFTSRSDDPVYVPWSDIESIKLD